MGWYLDNLGHWYPDSNIAMQCRAGNGNDLIILGVKGQTLFLIWTIFVSKPPLTC